MCVYFLGLEIHKWCLPGGVDVVVLVVDVVTGVVTADAFVG